MTSLNPIINAGQSPSVLITGAFGSIGRHVAKKYAAEGYTVFGLGNRGSTSAEPKTEETINLVEGAVSLDNLKALPVRPSVIVHCAGGSAVGAAITAPREDFYRTVGSTADLLEFIRSECPSAKLVYPSSAAVYGCAQSFPMHPSARVSPVSAYGLHKHIAEQMIMERARAGGLHAVIVRLFSVYGEGFRKQLLWDASRKIAAGQHDFFGTGEESRDWLHVSDAASLLCQVADHASAECPVLNGGFGERTAVRDILGELFKCLCPDATPRFCGTVRPGDPMHFHADIGDSLTLGWRPKVQWRDGIHRYADWFSRECGNSSSNL